MEVNEANLGQLAVYLQQTLSPQAEVNCFRHFYVSYFENLQFTPKVRKPAEDFLTSVETNQNYPVLLLSLLNSEAGELNIKVKRFKENVKIVDFGSSPGGWRDHIQELYQEKLESS